MLKCVQKLEMLTFKSMRNVKRKFFSCFYSFLLERSIPSCRRSHVYANVVAKKCCTHKSMILLARKCAELRTVNDDTGYTSMVMLTTNVNDGE